MITCYLRYVVDPHQLAAFEAYGKLWIRLVEKFGGKHHGYFMPSEGTSNVALAFFSFPSLAAYEDYRKRSFGDPECQVLMTRFDGDLVDLLLAVAQGKLAEQGPVQLADRTALTIVMAANNYPGTPEKGGTIAGIDAAQQTGAKVFHAGTADRDGVLVANGGRVLNVTATGDTVGAAQAAAYAAVDAIDFPTGFCRRDIGWREVAREAEKG